MKTYGLYYILIALGLVSLSCKDDIDNPVMACDQIINGWNLASYEFPKTQAQRDLFFLNDEVGFSVGNAGTILKTMNGGQSWQFLHYYYSLDTGFNDDAITDAMLYCVYFVNDSVGFVGGDDEDDYFNNIYTDAVFLRTKDGGKNWTKEYLEGISQVYDLIFFDELNGLGIFYLQNADNSHDYQIRTTNDGGYHWTEVVLPESRLLSRSFVTSPSSIKVVAENNLDINELWSTSDKGMTWQAKNLPGESFFSIYFINDEIGLANCTPIDIPQGNYQTKDGGETWVEIETPFSGWTLIHFSNKLEGFVINPVYEFIQEGWEGFEILTSFEGYQTFDGGISWGKSIVGADCGFDGLQYSPSNNKFYILDYPAFTTFEKP